MQETRDFLKTLASFAGTGLAGLLFPRRPLAQGPSTRVACVTDGQAWTGKGWSNDDLDLNVLKSMIERALADLTGQPAVSAALSSLIPDLGEANQRIGIKVVGCCVEGLPVSRCIDGELLTVLHPDLREAPLAKARGQRARCGCTESWDIGWYNPCPGGCLYCYGQPMEPSRLSGSVPD